MMVLKNFQKIIGFGALIVFAVTVMLVSCLNAAETENAKSIAEKIAMKKANEYQKINGQISDARLLYEQAKYNEAIDICKSILKLNPENSEAEKLFEACKKKKEAEMIAKKIERKKKNMRKVIESLDDEFIELYRRPDEYDKEKVERIESMAQTVRALWEEGKYSESIHLCEKITEIEPGNVMAKLKINELLADMRKYSEYDSELVERKRILEVTQAWIPPQANEASENGEKETTETPIISAEKQALLAKSNRVIPEINFTNAHLRDVIQYLSRISGVNIILDESVLSSEDTTVASDTAEDDRVSISLKNIPLLEALKYILITKGMKYRIEDHAIWIARNVDDVEMVTRTYLLPSGTGVQRMLKYDGETKQDEIAGGSSIETGGDITQLLKEAVPFPPNSKIFLDPRTSTLIITNTIANHSLIEDVLKNLSKPPIQVQIEAKFVKIREDDANELGLEFFLTKDWLGDGGDPNGIRVLSETTDPDFGQYSADASKYGFTRGLRYSGYKSSIFRLSGVLTEPQFSVILHALSQNKITDVISAPKLTVINGQQGIIKNVTEIIYPLEFTLTQATYNDDGSAITPSVVTVGDFQTRKVGIILSVTPIVGADHKTITMTIMPEVSEVQNWINFGSDQAPMRVPHFETENVVSTVIIHDSETVVMGGLIKEEVTTHKDKIPVLGDIPYVGRAFRSERKESAKTNLLVFVTCKIITPTGMEYKKIAAKEEEKIKE